VTKDVLCHTKKKASGGHREETQEGEGMTGVYILKGYRASVVFDITPKYTTIYLETSEFGVSQRVSTAKLYKALKDNDPLDLDNFKKVLKNTDAKPAEKQNE
jgi:hypothetical protein